MTLHALLAHTDPDGRVPPFFMQQVRALRASGADVLVVTSFLRQADADSLRDLARVSFAPLGDGDLDNLREGLSCMGADGDVLLSSDRVVGPFGPLQEVLPGCRDGREAKIVQVPSVRSTAFGASPVPAVLRFPAAALREPVVAALLFSGARPSARWTDLVTVLVAVGYVLQPSYQPSAADVARARARLLRSEVGRTSGSAAAIRRSVRRALDAPLDPLAHLGDAALDGRLGYLDLESLRRPVPGGRRDLLAALERRHPATVAGVRDALTRRPAGSRP